MAYRIAACIFFIIALLAPVADAAVRESASLRYYRGVYVLNQLYPLEKWPTVSIPRQFRTHDTTSALLAHPDKKYVLESVSRDLAEAMKNDAFPEAAFFAARAHAFRGNHLDAANAMQRYIAKIPFDDAMYTFLVKELYAAKEYTATRQAVREWLEKDTSDELCSEDRLTYAWASFQAQHRYREAMEEILADPCASWKGQVYFAKSSLSLGDEAAAEARIADALKAFPEKHREITRLWNRLGTAQRYP